MDDGLFGGFWFRDDDQNTWLKTRSKLRMLKITCNASCRKVFLLAVMTSFVIGCGLGAGKEDAEHVVSSYFETVKVKNYDEALNFYSEDFFKGTDPNKWRLVLEKVMAKLGDLQSYKLVHWDGRSQIGQGAGVYTNLQYKVTYTNGQALETFGLFKPSGKKTKIMGHDIRSDVFAESLLSN